MAPLPHDIAFVFQENALFPWNTVAENIRLGMLFQGVPKAEHEPRARKSLEAVGLAEFVDHYPGQLSGGMRQRAALARALSLETGILLMDEPFGALDEQTRMILGEDLSVLLSRTDKTIIFVTHSLGEAVFLADRVAVFSARPGDDQKGHPRRRAASTPAGIRHVEKFTVLRNELYALLHDEIRKTVSDLGGQGPLMARRDWQSQNLASRLVQLGFLVAILGLWYLATNRWGVNRLLLPNPVSVWRQLIDVLRSGEYLPDLRVTLTELAVAFVLATTSGTVVGFFVSRTRYSIRVFEPLFAGIYSIPIILFLPFYVLFFGLGQHKIALGTPSASFPSCSLLLPALAMSIARWPSRRARWAHPTTSCSATFWSRRRCR